MIEPYVNAAIRQAQERAKILKGKISQTLQAPELVALHQTCQDRIDKTINDLEMLLTGPLILRKDLVARNATKRGSEVSRLAPR